MQPTKQRPVTCAFGLALGTARGSRAILYAMLLHASIATTARADEPPDTTPAEDEEISEARALFMAGRVAFEEGRFDAALAHFKASYELSGRAGLLYNIGQCHDRLRKDREAIAAFEQYLIADPEAENRAAVEARLQTLRASLDKTARPSEADEGKQERPPSEQPARSAPPSRLGPTITLSAGALVGVTGGLLMFLGHQRGDDVENAKQGSSYTALRDDLDTAKRQWMVGQTLLGVGAVTVAAGVTWWLWQNGESRSQLHAALVPNGVRLGGQF